MVRSALTGALLRSQLSFPKPFSHTAAPRRPTTTAAPGYPPAEIPRWTTRSTTASRWLDMPTDLGAFIGRPPPPSCARRVVTSRRSTDDTYELKANKGVSDVVRSRA